MPAIPYIKKKIGNSHLVWLQNSNMYLQLEEPAWFVFQKTTQRYRTETIADDFAIRYDIPVEESLSFVKKIRLEIGKMNQMEKLLSGDDNISGELNAHTFPPFSIHRYRIGNKLLEFSFENYNFEQYLHPLISHFEAIVEERGRIQFELFSHQSRIVFRCNGEVKGTWTEDETQMVKGRIFISLINVMYDKTDDDWLMTVHASAITNGKKTILFSAAPGNGKTTFAALLQTRGFRLISDDFVPIARESFRAFPFPIAMSVKEGSMDLLASHFPSLKRKQLTYISPGKSVRYLPPDINFNITQHTFPVKEFVFIQYNSSVDFVLEKLDTSSALKLLLEQSWVPATPVHAKVLLDRISEVSFYQMTYSNNEKALDAITNLFNHD